MLYSAAIFSIFIRLVHSGPPIQELTEIAESPTEDDFAIPFKELEKDEKPITTLDEQCKRFVNHYRYYCRTSNIATYNEEVRIICERYRAYCSDRVYPAINHIRRQVTFWKQSGLPVSAQAALKTCYGRCKETDPVCVNACECIHLQWMMDYECNPGMRAQAGPNCQRWFAKCRAIWRPLPDLTPYPRNDPMAPHPIVRGQFYGYDAIGNYRTFNRPRDHGVSFFRQTNTVLVDWPEGKVSTAQKYEVPFAGVDVTTGLDMGFPNLRTGIRQFTKDHPDPLNPGTGRKASALSFVNRT